jgi:hypothetical protein
VAAAAPRAARVPAAVPVGAAVAAVELRERVVVEVVEDDVDSHRCRVPGFGRVQSDQSSASSDRDQGT